MRGNTRFEKTGFEITLLKKLGKMPVNLNIHERWRRGLRDFGLCSPARRESSCEGEHTSQRMFDGQVV